MPKDELRVSLAPPRLAALPDLARMVDAFGAAHGLPEPKTYMLNLALDELVANTVHYGFDGVAEPRIEITLWVSGTLLVLTVTDNGRRFDPTQGADPDLSSPVEERPVGGLGLHLVRTFADRLTYQFTEGRNRLTVEHNYTPAERADGRGTPTGVEIAEEREKACWCCCPSAGWTAGTSTPSRRGSCSESRTANAAWSSTSAASSSSAAPASGCCSSPPRR